MPFLYLDGTPIELDGDGFVLDPDIWNEQLAAALARMDGIGELSPSHWKIIRYIRDYHRDHELPPVVRKMCQETGSTLKEIYDLFPTGPTRGAIRVAGLTKPSDCV